MNDYQGLKTDLLREFQLTIEDYRSKFLSMRLLFNESASQFVSRLEQTFDRYMHLSGIPNNSDNLRELKIKDQFVFEL